ncbi:MAG: DMT family transporter [Gammaproteobacteria bacterium]|nr:DMT family transporter [Gammaproteobacteria bacterium]MBU2678371.1 DMT family transporter [Gammaproteobacteria bacterium]NNL52106.1 DMT family transporter [Woeseiaceae bacterium]
MGYLANPTVRLFAGAAMISFSPVWVKLVSVSPTTSGFYRVLFGSIALAAYLLFKKQRLNLSTRAWTILIGASIFFALDLWFWHRSINYIGPGLATLLANFQVFIMMFAGIILLHQVPRLTQVIAVPLALAGLAMIVGLDWRNLPQDYRLGVIFGLLTAVVYAGYLLTLREARRDSEHPIPIREVAVVSAFSATMLGLSAMIEGHSLAIPNVQDAVWLIVYGIFSQGIGVILIASSLRQVSTTEAGLALLLQPTLSFVWDVLFFARPMTATETAGAAIALIAIYLGSRPSSKQAQGAR